MVPDDLLTAVARVARVRVRDPVRTPLVVAVREIAARSGADVVVLQVPGVPDARFPEGCPWPPGPLLGRWHARVVAQRRSVVIRHHHGPAGSGAVRGVALPIFLPTGGVGSLGLFFPAGRPIPADGEMAGLLVLAGTAAFSAVGARLRQYTEVITTAEVHERIAREIHDGPLQVLSALLLRLRTGQGPGVRPPQDARGVVEAEVRRAIRQMRSLIGHLRLARSRAPLPQRLRSALARLEDARGVSWRLRWQGGEGLLRREVADELFAVINEALVNAARHAAATRVDVAGRVRGRAFEVVVRDNGVGFDVRRALQVRDSVRSFGLLSMQERVKDLGGVLTVRSQRGRGTSVVVRLPIASGKGGATGRRGE
jgi:signal transduction histidine kinase